MGADWTLMSVSGVSAGASACDSAGSAEVRALLILKKQQDVQKSEGQALVDLITRSTDGVGQRINVYA